MIIKTAFYPIISLNACSAMHTKCARKTLKCPHFGVQLAKGSLNLHPCASARGWEKHTGVDRMLKYLSIGQIISTHGYSGEMKVYPLTDDIRRFKKLKEVYVEECSGLVKYRVENIKLLSSIVVIKLEGINTEKEANSLKNLYVKIDRESAVKLPKDSYFICDLIDLEVFNENGMLLGTIKDVLQTGSNDVYVVHTGGKDILIPALKDVVRIIDLENKNMMVKLPEGLI